MRNSFWFGSEAPVSPVVMAAMDMDEETAMGSAEEGHVVGDTSSRSAAASNNYPHMMTVDIEVSHEV